MGQRGVGVLQYVGGGRHWVRPVGSFQWSWALTSLCSLSTSQLLYYDRKVRSQATKEIKQHKGQQPTDRSFSDSRMIFAWDKAVIFVLRKTLGSQPKDMGMPDVIVCFLVLWSTHVTTGNLGKKGLILVYILHFSMKRNQGRNSSQESGSTTCWLALHGLLILPSYTPKTIYLEMVPPTVG